MGRMVRKQIVIEPEQERALAERAKVLGVSQSALIRQAIDDMLETTAREARMAAFERFAHVARSSGTGSGGRRWTREEIHER